MPEGSTTQSAGGNVDFKAAFSLLPQVLKILRAVQVVQNDPQKQQQQVQAAVSDENHSFVASSSSDQCR